MDTSVWMRFLRDRAPYLQQLRGLLARRGAIGHELVYGELLIGDRGGRPQLLASYDEIPWASTVAHQEVVHLVRSRDLHGRGLSWIDAHLLASAIVDRLQLWTADERFAHVASEVGVGYEPVPDAPGSSP